MLPTPSSPPSFDSSAMPPLLVIAHGYPDASLLDQALAEQPWSVVTPDDLADAFGDVAEAAADCRFADCRHVGEAGCAVEGRVESARLASYRKLLEELERG